MTRLFHLTAAAAALILFVAFPESAFAEMEGPCSDCHTMHNSQDNQPMRYDSGDTPLPQLLRGDCYGCHARGGSEALVTVGINVIPQVYHVHPTDLAGGNFAYINGVKNSPGGASDAKGHNITDLWGTGGDDDLNCPPGHHNDEALCASQTNRFTVSCAGSRGCHGLRGGVKETAIAGAHHDNVSGAVAPPSTDMNPGHSYRFLLGVKGYEDTDWQFTSSAADHNEYFGISQPVELDCDAARCHVFDLRYVRPPHGTMGQYCATCHKSFHSLDNGRGDEGIGTGTSPFLRHPSDLSLPNSGEYAGYTAYLPITPVARLSVVAPTGTINKGSDAVFCLSCHMAHASPYPDMLKWDYTAMEVGNGGGASGTGCFACHSSKD